MFLAQSPIGKVIGGFGYFGLRETGGRRTGKGRPGGRREQLTAADGHGRTPFRKAIRLRGLPPGLRRCADIAPVRIKSIEQQALQSLHRTRSLWMATRTARINALRGFCREFGIVIAAGSRVGLEQIGRVLADPNSALPTLLRDTAKQVLEEIRLLEARITQLEAQLSAAARQSAPCATLLSVPGVGLLTATALVAATGGTVAHFRSARHFAAWFGLTPKESSSGATRHLGRISKRGDRYLRMLLTHGARSVRRAASVAQRAGQPLDALRQWALAVQARSDHDKTACALANKLARISYAALRDQSPFDGARLNRKLSRQAYALPL